MSFIPSITNIIDVNNSFSAALTGNETKTGQSTLVTQYNSLEVSVTTDVSSVVNGLSIQFSSNGTNWDTKYTYTVLANNTFVVNLPVQNSYFRVVYTNDTALQSFFRLQTILQSASSNSLYLLGETENKIPKTIKTNVSGNLTTSIRDPITAFGEVLTAEADTVFQGDYVYGVNTDIYKPILIGGGTLTTTNGLATVTTGANTNSLGYLQTLSNLRYRSGQGAVLRFSAMFSTGVSGNIQLAGGGNFLSGVYFGYNGTSFGINRLAGGTLAVQTLNITTGATSASNCTVTLYDGATSRAFTVPLTVPVPAVGNQTATAITAAQIAAFDYTTLYPGWIASSNGSLVTFVCMLAQANNTVTFTAGTTGATATATSVTIGVVPSGTGEGGENEFIAKSSWNIDTMDGTGNINNPSGLLLDPTKGNVYQIQIQYLGFGAMTFSIENKNTGLFQPVHQIKYANSYTVRNLKIPNLSHQIITRNTTNNTTVSVLSASNFGAVQGKYKQLAVSRSFGSGVLPLPAATTTLTAFSIRPSVIYNGLYSTVNLKPKSLAVSNDNNNPIKVTLMYGPSLSYLGTKTTWSNANLSTSINTACLLNWANYNLTANSLTAPTGGVELLSLAISTGGQSVIDLEQYHCNISSFQSLAVIVSALGGLAVASNNYLVSLQWEEEQ